MKTIAELRQMSSGGGAASEDSEERIKLERRVALCQHQLDQAEAELALHDFLIDGAPEAAAKGKRSLVVFSFKGDLKGSEKILVGLLEKQGFRTSITVEDDGFGIDSWFVLTAHWN